MAKRNEPVIITKRPLARRAPLNNGAWKVAFADFTLAMMALFMVLWIIQMADQTEREQIVQYLQGDMFATGSINPFNLNQSPTMIDLEGSIPIQQAILPATGTGVEKAGPALHNHIPVGEDNPKAGRGPELNAMVPGTFETQAQLEYLAREIQKITQQANMSANVAIKIVPQGIRILVHDNVRQSMFTRGSAKMAPYFEDLLLALGPLLAKVENKISISGHTDSSSYAGKNFTNWELSSQRALMARRVLEYGGVKRNQIVQVTGMADQAPFITNDPKANANRRIELLVLTQKAEQQVKEMAGFPTEPIKSDPRLEQAKKLAENNRPRTRYPEQWTSNE